MTDRHTATRRAMELLDEDRPYVSRRVEELAATTRVFLGESAFRADVAALLQERATELCRRDSQEHGGPTPLLTAVVTSGVDWQALADEYLTGFADV